MVSDDIIARIMAARETPHGDFAYQAAIYQKLKRVAEVTDNWPTLSDTQKEGLEMILLKIARILAGNPDHLDHWHDIAGYAKLTADYITNAASISENSS